MPKRYPEAFRRKVLDLVAAGRPIAQIAADLDISDQTVYGWRKQELVDTGQLPGLNRCEQAGLAAANKRTRELETEVAIPKRARELRGHSHYGRRRTTRAEGLPAAVGSRVGLLRLTAPPALGPRGPPRLVDRAARNLGPHAPTPRNPTNLRIPA